jgi:hypothetical protein
LNQFLQQILFLSEAGGVTPEMRDSISSLAAMAQPASAGTKRRKGKPPASTTQVLPKPLVFSVEDDYIGPDDRYLVAQLGDDVIVYAWANDEEVAIAYNSRNDKAGRIPACLLKKRESQPRMTSEIGVSFSSNLRDASTRIGDLTWKSGEHIRICKWKDGYMNSGTGFNLSTGEIGRFHVLVGSIKVLQL